MNILGIHGGVSNNQHDAAAALIVDGKLAACVEEERMVRIKGPRGLLPIESINAVLNEARLTMHDIDLVVHPGETYDDAPARITSYLRHYFGHAPSIRLVNHQTAHVASAFFHSGYERAMCLSYDAYGDGLSAQLAVASRQDGVKVLESREWTNSLGAFYATMTSYLGFLPAEDEYKIMGLAPYGSPRFDLSSFAKPVPDGYFVDMSFMRQDPPLKSNWEPFYSDKLIKLVGEPRRKREPIDQRHRDVAYATQKALEDCAVSLVSYLHSLTQEPFLCLAGGVALNCSANFVLRSLPFVERLFVQPAASDRGLALGCALQAAKQEGIDVEPLQHVYYGPTYLMDEVRRAIRLTGFQAEEVPDPAEFAAGLIAEGCIVGWCNGRSEFGPRALGNRSILADPQRKEMKDEINARVKFREEFRPFAPSVIEEKAHDIFVMDEPSPYMTMAFKVREGWEKRLPATTHVNGTARVQTVGKTTAPDYHRLISAVGKQTGAPVVLNTSFNIKGQPIVETPLDAISTFAGSGMDALFLGPFMIRKPNRPRG